MKRAEYNMYAEKVTDVMTQAGLIVEEERPEMIEFIRECA